MLFCQDFFEKNNSFSLEKNMSSLKTCSFTKVFENYLCSKKKQLIFEFTSLVGPRYSGRI